MFYEHGASLQDVLHYAAESKRPDRLPVMVFLLDRGADSNAIKWEHDEQAYQLWSRFGLGTPLHHAVMSGHIDRVQLLLDRGADAGILDSNGDTALQIAQEKGKADIVALLAGLRAGTRTNGIKYTVDT